MTWVSVDIPPGLYRNGGTERSAKGRWYAQNLMRWYEGTMQPIGGWAARTTATISGKGRAAISWRDNSNTRRVAVGTHTNLYAATSSATTMTDITPVGFTTGRADATTAGGYGTGNYGVGTYGTPRLDVATILEADVWSLDTFGQNLLGCMPTDGRIWYWQLSGVAAALTGAPTSSVGVVVSPERFVFALGAAGNRRRVQWSDQEAETTWTPAATNQAGDFDLQTSGQIMCGKRLRSGTLIWTDVDVHLATYIRLPLVYSFDKVGDNCGAISRGACVVADSAAYWMSPAGFYRFDGVTQQMPCDVWDEIQTNLNAAQRSKITGFINSTFSEVWWFYPSQASTECDKVVVFNIREGHWNIHDMTSWVRLCAIDRGVMTNPIAVGNDGNLYDHETGASYSGVTPFAESGPFEIGEGERVVKVRTLIPDEKTQGDVRVSFKLRDWPNALESTVGPFTMSNPVDVRFSARQVRMRVEGVNTVPWRFGTPRFDVVQGGRR